jgi:hypothetical protein
MDVITSRNCPRPADLVEGTTVCIIREGIHAETVADEDGTVSIEHVCTEYRLTPAEYAMLKKGSCSYWTPSLHAVYRRELHRRTDDLYVLAQRMVRDGADKTAWEDYMKALDDWNRAVSAMATGFSTAEPPLPAQPGR